MIGDETREVTVVPLITLAVYEGDRLEAVYPHANGIRPRIGENGSWSRRIGDRPLALLSQ